MKRIQLFILLGLIFALSACSWWGKGEEDDANSVYRGMTAQQLYDEAEVVLHKGQYESAAKRFEALESMYPFSDHAEQAQEDLIYAYYKKGDYPSAAATAERFIHLYPRARHVDYAYYMKGLSNFQQSRGTFANFLPLDESWRDPGTQSQAYSDFATLVQKFPESRYKPNALQRLIYLRNMFANRELNTSKYYYDRKMYVAAAERASFLVKNYQQAPSNKEGLVILYNSNLKLGLHKAADDAAAVYASTYHSKPPVL